MATPIPYDYRKKIVRMRKEGKTFKAISQSVGYPEKSVKRIWYRYVKEGEAGLATKYHHSGRRSPFDESISQEIARVRDGEQGAPYVRSILLERHPELNIPHERTIQRWWKAKGAHRPKGRPKVKSNWATEPNHTWQIDGKGHIRLKDGQKASWMNIADEATSCDLHTCLFPPTDSRSHSN